MNWVGRQRCIVGTMNKPYKFFTWTSSDEIVGLDEPMIDPRCIPYGYVQSYVNGEWWVHNARGGPSHYSFEDLPLLYQKLGLCTE